MATKGDSAVTGTRAGLQRLVAGTRPPPRPRRADQTGMDVRGKNAEGMRMVDEHPASATVHRAFTDIVGTVPVPDVPMDALRRPRPGNLPLDPASGVAKWLAGRAPILATGPRGTNERTDSGVAKELAPVNQQFWLAANGRIDAARAGLDQRGVDLPLVPVLGEEEAVMPAPPQATQLAAIEPRVRDDYRQWAEYSQRAVQTNNRALAGLLVSVGRRNTLPDGPWFKGTRYDKVAAWLAHLTEFFRTPAVAAGEVNRTLTELQHLDLTGLATALNSRSVEQDLPTLLFNHAFPWLEAPAPDADLADRYDRIMQLATGAEARAPRELDASGERLSATEGEDPLPIQTTGDRGDAQL